MKMHQRKDRTREDRQKQLESEIRTLGTIGKHGLAGFIGGVPDVLNLAANAPFYAANAFGANTTPPMQYLTPKIAEGIDYITGDKLKSKNPKEQSTENVLGTLAEFMGAGKSTAIPKAGKIGKWIAPYTKEAEAGLAGAGIAGGYGKELFPDNPYAQFGSALAGGFAPSIASGIGSAGKYAANIHPRNFAMNQLEGIDPKEAIAAKQAGERLGVQLRPAETTGNPFIAAKEGKVGTSIKGSNKMYQHGLEREGQITNAIEDLYSSIAPEGTKQKIKDLYTKADPILLPDKTFTHLMSEQPILAKTLNKVLKGSEYQNDIKGFSQNSTKVLNIVKQELDDAIEVAKKGSTKGSGPNRTRRLTSARKELVNAIDEINPDYKTARSEAQKEQIVSKIQKKIGSINEGGANFFNKALKDKKIFNDIYRGLEGNSEAQGKMNDMRIAFKNLIEPVSTKMAARQAQTAPEASKFGKTAMMQKIADKIMNGAYDNAAIDLILDPKWDKRIKDIKALPKTEQTQAWGTLLSQAEASQSQSKEAMSNQENTSDDSIVEEQDLINQIANSEELLNQLSPEEFEKVFNLYQAMQPAQ
jgi:hypothetical protein